MTIRSDAPESHIPVANVPSSQGDAYLLGVDVGVSRLFADLLCAMLNIIPGHFH
jgi:hypothetical protein